LFAEPGSQTPDAPAIVERFQQLLEAELGRRPERSALRQVLGEIEGQLLREWGTAYGAQWEGYLASLPAGVSLLPAHFETSFGRGSDAGESSSEKAPLVIGAGDCAVRVGGRIDRIDVGMAEGRTVFAVIDYKSGRTRADTLEEIQSGRALQLAIYSLAVVRLGLVGPAAAPLQMGYWHIRDTGFSPGIRSRRRADARLQPLEAAVWSSLETMLDDIIPRLAAAMRAGKFPVFNDDDECTGHCPYRTVCRVNQIRALPEGLRKNWSV
jgi:hypothetical protein